MSKTILMGPTILYAIDLVNRDGDQAAKELVLKFNNGQVKETMAGQLAYSVLS